MGNYDWKDLRVGNIMLIHGRYQRLNIYHIGTLSRQGCLDERPVRLEKDLMEHIEFSYDYGDWYASKYTTPSICVNIKNGLVEIQHCYDNIQLDREIYYVHELQNFVKELAAYELEIDIDKLNNKEDEEGKYGEFELAR